MNKLLLVIVILGISFAHAADSYDSAKVHEIVQKLKKSDYGRNILTTIQLEIASGVDESAIKRIVRMLNELVEQVQGELTTLTAERAKKNGYCNGRIEDLTNNLSRLTVDISEREALVPPVENLRDQKDKDRKAKDQEISIKQDDLRQIHEANEEERQIYFQQREEHDALIAELNRAKEILSSLKKTNFLEKKDHQAILAQLASHATDALKNIKVDHKKSVFTFVMTLAQQVGVQADQDLVKKVSGIIDELIAEEEYAKQIEFEAENLRLERFEFDVHRVESAITDLDAWAKQLLADVKAINLRLTETRSDIQSNQQTLASKAEELESTKQECTDSLHSKDQSLKAYAAEEELILETVKLMSSQAVKQIDQELGF